MPTILHRLHRWAEADPRDTAHRFKVDGQWTDISADELWNRVYHLALFLRARGFGPGDITAILSPNNHPWVVLELASLLAGGCSGGLYPNSTVRDIHYILNQTESKVLGVKNREFFDKVLGEERDQAIPASVQIVLVLTNEEVPHPGAIGFTHALAEGERLARDPRSPSSQDLLNALDPQAGAFLIFTSGTTGNPKGAVLTHDNLAYGGEIASRNWDLPWKKGDLFSFLPLCHVAEKVQNLGVGITQRYRVTFATTFEGVAKELPEVNPSLLLSVPRLWEKMMEAVLEQVQVAPEPRKRLMKWALEVGERVAAAKYTGNKPNPADIVQWLVADRLVLSKIRAALGLPRPHSIASGAASLPAHVSKWFRSIGLEILEVYGQTESTALITMTERGVESAGTVGRPVRGTEFKLAEDGEILTRGRHVFKEYYKDAEQTRATLEDGWLKTGDLAEYTPEGLVRIRGRKKEIMKSSGGKMVAPVPIEERLKVSSLISQACMVGDGRKYFSAILTLAEPVLKKLEAQGVLKQDPDLIRDAEILKQVEEVVDGVNQELAPYERIKKFAVLNREFSIGENEMTPTLKMKRAVIEQKFKDIIDHFYL